MRADQHPSNPERLQTLRDYHILDTPEEEDFDELVELASEICGTPISLISLVDEERQWFKARKGLDAQETPFDRSVCAHAILNGDYFEVTDMQADPRTADNPLVTGEENNLRFYAGVPLFAANGHPLGTLCVLDRKPLQLDPFQRKSLQVLSRQVMKQFELRVALRKQESLQAEADHRVKNSLQSLAAITRIYARGVSDAAALDALAAIERRISAMAQLHLEMQRGNDGEIIDASPYLSRVLNLLQDSAPGNVEIRSEFASVVLRADQAANIAMILSEFVANSIKHAFPDGRHGEITARLEKLGQGAYRLTCADDGIGLSARKTPDSKTDGIGLSLVKAAAASLGGNSSADLTPDGSRLVLDFGADLHSPDAALAAAHA